MSGAPSPSVLLRNGELSPWVPGLHTQQVGFRAGFHSTVCQACTNPSISTFRSFFLGMIGLPERIFPSPAEGPEHSKAGSNRAHPVHSVPLCVWIQLILKVLVFCRSDPSREPPTSRRNSFVSTYGVCVGTLVMSSHLWCLTRCFIYLLDFVLKPQNPCFLEEKKRLGVMVHTYNFSVREGEAGGSLRLTK